MIDITYNVKTEIGCFTVKGIRYPFERSRTLESYNNMKNYIIALGGTDEDAREFAGHLDYPKPGQVIAKIIADHPDVAHLDWQRILADTLTQH